MDENGQSYSSFESPISKANDMFEQTKDEYG